MRLTPGLRFALDHPLSTSLRALVLMCAGLLLGASFAHAATKCLDDPGDASQIGAARTAVDAACDCAAAAKHAEYAKCAAGVVKALSDASQLRKECKGTVTRIYANSTCGKPPAKKGAFLPCVAQNTDSGKVTCAIKPSGACVTSGKNQRDGCPASTTCLDAADTNGDLRIGTGDSGDCATPSGPIADATMLGQLGLDSANTGSNDAETTLDASNVGSVVAKFDLDLSAYGTGADLGEPVFASNGNLIVTAGNEVISVTPAGAVAWHVTLTDPHPEIATPHIISVYGDDGTVDVLVDTKVQGAAPGYAGGSIVKLDNATGNVAASQSTFRPAAPLGYASNHGLVVTGEVIDHATYGSGRTVTIDVTGSGRRIIRNAVGAVRKPAVEGDQVVVAAGGTVYRWSAPCAPGTVCDETTAATTAVVDATRPLLIGTTAYVTSLTGGTLYAIGPDGTVLWTGSVGNAPADAAASVAAGNVYVGNTTGIFYGFPLGGCGAATCSRTYINSFIDSIATASTLANGLAYLMAQGRLVVARTDCTLVENCSPKKSITLNGPILGSSQQVLVKDGRIYVLTNDGHLRAWGL